MSARVAGRVRCAIYTRKSTDEGLDQSFNTLDAQREACEAYICSQVGEGWRTLPGRYDDGGFSGGNLDRPAMQRLLDDVDAGKVDVIVVYKVDRLTRSLLDFAKIVERLDARGVSFVSITQAFNTTTSMGRLTLNVLLSFAQFEREVTGERIRDKIAASKAKGMWMGGNVPLGYDLGDRRLIVNPVEAATVRRIFERYVALGSGVLLAKELRRDRIAPKQWVSRAGQIKGGTQFSCGALYYMLQNRLYLGEIVHRGAIHAGEHDAIIDQELFDATQATLAEGRRARKERPSRKTLFQLAGRVVDAEGSPLATSFSYGRGGRQYRYYVLGSLDPLRPENVKPKRVPAGPLERLVLRLLTRLYQRDLTLAEAKGLIGAVELRDRSIQIVLMPDRLVEPYEPVDRAVGRLQHLLGQDRLVQEGKQLRIIVDRQPSFRGRTNGNGAGAATGSEAEVMRTAHRLLEAHSMSPLQPERHSGATAPVGQRHRRQMSVALLDPAIQKQVSQGALRLPAVKGMPLAWVDQRTMMRTSAHDRNGESF